MTPRATSQAPADYPNILRCYVPGQAVTKTERIWLRWGEAQVLVCLDQLAAEVNARGRLGPFDVRDRRVATGQRLVGVAREDRDGPALVGEQDRAGRVCVRVLLGVLLVV